MDGEGCLKNRSCSNVPINLLEKLTSSMSKQTSEITNRMSPHCATFDTSGSVLGFAWAIFLNSRQWAACLSLDVIFKWTAFPICFISALNTNTKQRNKQPSYNPAVWNVTANFFLAVRFWCIDDIRSPHTNVTFTILMGFLERWKLV